MCTRVAASEITMRLDAAVKKQFSLSWYEARRYIETGEPMDKAGAYGIQGFGATIVERVEGDYFAVMGLPLQRLTRLLEQLELAYEFGAIRRRV